MLNIQRNRLNYGELLAPPEGFELVKAVGTTYSLDLYALLAIPVSLFYSKSMEGDFTLNRYDVLDAIRKSKEKVDLFCQRGKIKVPKEYHTLFAFMEDCVVEQTPHQKDASFHPKLWVLRFESKKETRYRLIVLSRNLTFDRSWDIAYYADGIPTGNKDEYSGKLSSFIEYLYKESDKEIEPSFLKELETVQFDPPHNFKGFGIYPVLPGSNNSYFANPVALFKYSELLIISPFVKEAAIAALKKFNHKITLVSRKEELDRLDLGALKDIDVYCIKELIVNGENYTDTEGEEPLSQNLHAKIFIGENSNKTDWFMGSANCTSAALKSNTEILVKVSSTKKHLRLAEIKEQLLNSEPSYFEKYKRSEIEIDDVKESAEEAIRSLIFSLCKLSFVGTVIESENENKTVYVEVDLSDLIMDNITVSASLLHKEEEHELMFGQINQMTFTNIPITQLSKYLVLKFSADKIMAKGILIKMAIEIPSEREDVIFKSLINSKDKFYKYLQFLLSPQDLQNSPLIDSVNTNGIRENEKSTLQDLFGVSNPIYEALMLAASRNPKKLAEINKVVEKLQKMDEEVVSDFLEIWNVFKEFAHE